MHPYLKGRAGSMSAFALVLFLALCLLFRASQAKDAQAVEAGAGNGQARKPQINSIQRNEARSQQRWNDVEDPDEGDVQDGNPGGGPEPNVMPPVEQDDIESGWDDIALGKAGDMRWAREKEPRADDLDEENANVEKSHRKDTLRAVNQIRAVAYEELRKTDDPERKNEILTRQVTELEQLLFAIGVSANQQAAVLDEQGKQMERFHAAQEKMLVGCRATRLDLYQQKRAFAQLHKEKMQLVKSLVEEAKVLETLQERVRNPDLAALLLQRGERLARHFDTPESDAVAFYANRFMKSRLSRAGASLHSFEKTVEETVDKVLHTRYSSFVGLILTCLMVGVPAFVVLRYVMSLTTALSARQHVLVGNLFLAMYSIGICVGTLILRQDSLSTMFDASESLFILVQFGLAVYFFAQLSILGRAVLRSRDRQDAVTFGLETVLYILVGANYHERVWKPAMLGMTFNNNTFTYMTYIFDFCVMTALTISTSELPFDRASYLPQHSAEDVEDQASHGSSSALSARAASQRVMGSTATPSKVVGDNAKRE